jgi:hypothetical protein
MWSAGQGDDKERFLADLRALRDRAVLELDELAARAHYPSAVLKEAENGPSLPGLPILAAYVRACDGDVPEWEERWRRLGFESRADPSLPVRPAGASPAAVAGARAAVSVAPPDAYDPDRIRAALRGSHARSDHGGGASRAAPGWDTPGPATAEPRAAESPASWSAGTTWESVQGDGGARWDGTAADLSGAKPNGNHHASQPGDGSPDPAVIGTPDSARADAIRRDPFSPAWLHDGDPTSPAEPESRCPDEAGAGLQAADADSWFTPRERDDRERTGPTADAQPSPAATDSSAATHSSAGTDSSAATDGWFSPHERADGALPPPHPAEPDVASRQEHAGPTAPGRARFWTPSADVSSAAEVQQPGPSPVEGQAVHRPAWTAPAETPADGPPGAADRTTPIRAPAAAAAPSRTTAGPPVPSGSAVPQRKSRSERLYPVRLLVVIVVAALIGSILVLLLR